jgi:cytochrome P450
MGLFSWFTANRRLSAADDPDIASPEHKADPFPFYARLRAEKPVHRVTVPGGVPALLVTRYDDVVAVLKDDRFSKDRFSGLIPELAGKQPWMPAMFRPLARNMLDLDPPDHTRLRAVVQSAFTPRIVEQMRPRIETLADELLDRLVRRGRFNLIHDYALPIPTTVITDMLGVPAADRHRFHRWSQAIVASPPSGLGALKAFPHVWLFLRFIRRLIRMKRLAQTDDLLSALIQAEEAGDRLNDDELVAMSFLLLVAGHETTVNLIGNGMLALMQNPEQMDRLRAEPGLIKPAVEELLRFGSPVQTATERFAREGITIAGVTLPRGSQVLAVLASANRDEQQFPDADRLDLTREPNKHLAFGLGRHFCLGAALARLEGQIAIGALMRRAPGIRLGVSADALKWRRGLVVRGLKSLPVEVQ